MSDHEQSGPPGVPPRSVGGSPPVALMLGIVTGMLLLYLTSLPLRDVDLYWHLRAGAELLAGTSPAQIGSDWSYGPGSDGWVTTQWLSEVALHVLHDLGGWSTLIILRTVTACIAVAILAHATLRGRPPILAGFPFVLAAAAIITVSQERPNQATLIGAACLGAVLLTGLNEGRLPRWWLLLPGTWLWANLHGGWVLAPAVMLLIALGQLLDHGVHNRVALRSALLAVAAGIAGTLTPAGTESTFAALRFSSAAGLIQEWGRTIPLEGPGLLVLGMGLLLAVSWARSRPPRSEMLAAILLFVFALMAIRNVAPALAILAPVVAERTCRAFPAVGRAPEPRWSAPVGIAIAVVMTLAGISRVPGGQHLPTDEFPVALASQIAQLPGAQRVLNDYNVAGLVLHLAKPEDRVAIDGRTDRYGAPYIESYVALQDLQGDWEPLLDQLDPTVALLEAEGPLAHVLIAERDWSVIGRDGDWVLLVPPAS